MSSRNMERSHGKRSRSAHSPSYHSISETYSKEVSTRPIGSIIDFPPKIVDILRENGGRSRENTWTSENFPIVRIPSSQSTDLLTELIEIEKFTRRSVTPELEVLRRAVEVEHIALPPHQKRLPMYSEYVNQLRHVDSDDTSSEDTSRHVYSHVLHVDPTSGRPYTPGRADLDTEKCPKLKINVYFKPPHPPVEPTYQLDEIEITSEKTNSTSILRKENEILRSKRESPEEIDYGYRNLPYPRKEFDSGRSQTEYRNQRPKLASPEELEYGSEKYSNPTKPKLENCGLEKLQYTRGISKTLSDVSRQQSEVNIPVKYSNPTNHGGIEKLPYTRGISKTPSDVSRQPSEVNIPVKYSNPTTVVSRQPGQKYSNPTSRTSTLIDGRYSNPRIEKLPYTRGISKTPSDVSRPTKYSNPTTVDYPRQYSNPKLEKLSYTRGISKTPSDVSRQHSEIDIPVKYSNPTNHGGIEKLPYTRGISKTPSNVSRQTSRSKKTPDLTTNYGLEKLQYTRGISKTPSDVSRQPSEINIPVKYSNPAKTPDSREPVELKYSIPTPDPTTKNRPDSKYSNPPTKDNARQKPYEEIVHIKERYERDETVRRIFPQTTTV